MFKPLLRTLPTLSGNVKLACSLSDYSRVVSTNNVDWTCFVRYARLLPLSSNLAQRKIEANLLYSSYEYDIQRFFKHYSSVFYDDVFEFDKANYILIDNTEAQRNRNTDFEFGVKRVSYLKNDAQFAFYAPIYIESIDDLPDYFLIHILLKNEKYYIERNIRVNISKEDVRNYLLVYLKRYLKEIDSNVIFTNISNKQATYYGIDCLKGGFTKVVDSIVSKVLARQNTINNFDAVITNGFQRNGLIIRQIIPFAWYFNINDILSDDEIEKFKNSNAYFSGYWYKNGERLPFYNIDTNYQKYFEAPYSLNISNGIFSYKNTGNNLMNMGYPSLNESMYTGYRYSNKLNVMYNRWKLRYSEDSHPYITNLSPAFSINQNSIYKYGGFPERYSTLSLITDTKNNVILPIGNALTDKKSPYLNDYKLVSNYLNTINNNVSTWYSLVNNIDNIYDEDIWKEVEHNKVYYKGILYDFTKIYEQFPGLYDTIDKFSIIVNLHFNVRSKEDLKKINKADTSIFRTSKYMTDKTAWVSPRVEDGFSNGEFNSLPMFYNNASSFGQGNAQLVFDKLYAKAENEDGDFIDLLSLGYDIYNINNYYKYSDIVTRFNEDTNLGVYENIMDKLSKNENFDSFFLDGYELLPVYKLNNILASNNRDICFETNNKADWVIDNLYFSQHGNYYKTPYDRYTLQKLIQEYGSQDKMIPVYLKGKFISYSNLISMLYDIYKEDYLKYNTIIESLTEYEYWPRIKDETSATYACDVYIQKDRKIGDKRGNFVNTMNEDDDVLYVDRYNLNNVIDNYNQRFGTGYYLPNEADYTRSMYAKFLNMKHLLYYVSDLGKDENGNYNLEKIVKSLYIRKRVIVGNSGTENLAFKDLYIPILDLYDKYRPLTKEEKIRIINSVDTDSSASQDIKSESYYSFIANNPDEVPLFYTKDSQDKIHGIPDNSEMGLSFEYIINYCRSHANQNQNADYSSQESIENIGINAEYYTNNIFIKDTSKNTYSADTYKLVQYGDTYKIDHIIFWHCDQYDYYHDVFYDLDAGRVYRKVTHTGRHEVNSGEYLIYKYNWFKSGSMHEYHGQDYYFLPTYYVRNSNVDKNSGKVTYSYTSFDEYIKSHVKLSNKDFIKYVNKDLIDCLIKTDVEDLDVNDIAFGNGVHLSLQPSGFDFIDITNAELLASLKELQNQIREIIPSIQNNIYYEDYSNKGNYIKYADFKGINDYIILSSVSMKTAIINGDLDLVTYIIDDEGNFVESPYDTDDYYTLRHPSDDDYNEYLKSVVSEFLSDVQFYEGNNYFMMSDSYNRNHDLDSIIGIDDTGGVTKSDFKFEVVYRADFNKINKDIFDLIHLDADDGNPYKDLYIYRLYKADEYPSSLRMYYYDNSDFKFDIYSNDDSIHRSLAPLFNDIILQDKEYAVIYTEYNQANIYEVTVNKDNEKNYRYNLSDTVFMYDISDLPYNKEYAVKLNGSNQFTYCYTYSYWNELKALGHPSYRNHSILPTYNLINSCYSNISYVSDSLEIYDKFNINTYSFRVKESYTYSYVKNTVEKVEKDGSYYSVLTEKEYTGTGIRDNITTYGFILLDAYIDNTNSSFDIVDTQYKKKKYYTYINEHDIYDPNFNILDSFNLLIPFSRMNLIENLYKYNDVIIHPTKCVFNTYYKQTPVNDDNGFVYAYNINKKNVRIDTITLQRYFDDIVPYIPETSQVNAYCLKYKNYKYSKGDVNYVNDIFYEDSMNIYNFNQLRVYDETESYTMYVPIEYKHFNDSKFINLPEEFTISENGVFTYDELLELEKDENVIQKFKHHILKDKLNLFKDNEILFLFNRYKVEYDTECVGLNPIKTQKIYTLNYKFILL